MKVLTIIEPGFEEIELITVIDLLRRANINIDTISIANELYVTGSHNITIKVDMLYSMCDIDDYQALFLPGGPGVKNMYENEEILDLVKDFYRDKKDIYAICAAPSILLKLGILDNTDYTCYPGYESKSSGNKLDEGVVTSDKIITASGVGTAIKFALEIIKKIKGIEFSQKIAEDILYKE